jgi:major membrane immunogen (membrane-anchored lipoprotein)
MKSQLIAIVAALLVVGCGESAPDMSIHDAAKLGDT